MKTFCSYYNQSVCRSCDLITVDYTDQIKIKEQKLKTALKELTNLELENTITSPQLGFRNKAKFSVTGTLENPVIGLTGDTSLDEGRELLECSLHVPEINSFLPHLKEFIKITSLTPYSISEKKGELKGIIVFYSGNSKEAYVRFVLRSKESIDRIRKHKDFLTGKIPSLRCISVNIQPVPHAIPEGDTEIFISDVHSITHQLGKIHFSLGPRAFVQTNQVVAEKLYATAAEWVNESRLSKFMELFCGQGAFSLFSAPSISKGLGIEINPDAVKEANKTAQELGLNNLQFKAADAQVVESEIKQFHPEIILVNPPRRGLGKSCELIMNSKPEMIIYSSCNYETLASDLSKLADDFIIERIKIFDMFPHTSHFETLVQLRAKAG